MKRKEININLWSAVMFTLVAIILIFFSRAMKSVNFYVREQAQIESNRRLCEEASQDLADGSDYLTNEVWRFVATREVKHLENYWREVNKTKSRDKAIEQLDALSLTEAEQNLIQNAKQESDELIKLESWAMRLAADSIGLEVSQMPSPVAAVLYSEGEESLTPEAKSAMASQYLFGEEYTEAKTRIKNSIAHFRSILRERKNQELKSAMNRAVESLRTAHILMAVLILTFIAYVVFFYTLVIRPFSFFTRTLKRMDGDGFEELPLLGAHETRAFAAAFNKIFSEWQEQTNKLEEERYRFHVALENTSVIVYEYDIAADTYMTFGSLNPHHHSTGGLQKERKISHFLESYARDLMGQEGIDYFCQLIEGDANRSVELPLSTPAALTPKTWVRITGTPVYGKDGKVARLIGKVTNIQSEKEKEFALKEARERDGLTGLYKKEAGIRRVRGFMESKNPDLICGLMILDMDDFGLINESEGTTFADAVLQDVADILKSMTEPDDILTRLGGDEFMLFIKNCPKSRATVLGPNIAERIRSLFAERNPQLKVSASIGMCVTEVVDEYSGLYRCAESTLKYVKEHNKGQAACYLDVSNELGMMLTQIYPESHLINDIEGQGGSWEDIPAFALELLGKCKNLDDAIYLLLSRVGKTCGLDRVLIMEIDTEFLSSKAVHQWTRRPSDRLAREVIYLTKKDLENLTGGYDADGLCDRRIITGPTNMQSILHAAIWNYDQCAGAVSFERLEARQWTSKERRLLRELTRIISSFTLKARADAVSQAKTDFLSRMSHEIRTPMNAITGMTIIAKTVPGNPPKTVECLDKIATSNKYLLNLINDILDMSRIESGKVEIHTVPTSLEKLTQNLDNLIRPQAEAKGLNFIIKNEFPNPRRVMADELRLNQILVNLLGNAVKFTDTGGSIVFAITPVEAAKEEVKLRFSVSDTGIGISADAQTRIFNAFEQAESSTASNYGGTGLGLTISSRLAQLMGSNLTVDSKPGKGSTFLFTICLSYAPLGEEEELLPSGQENDSFDPQGIRLLLVEDNPLNREIAQEILKMHGFEVDIATNGKEALNQFSQNLPGSYQAILMDIRMPVMGGIDAARKIRTMGRPDSRTIPIIAMTANAFDDDMKKSLENGMDGHLSKPIDVEALMLKKLISTKKKQPD